MRFKVWRRYGEKTGEFPTKVDAHPTFTFLYLATGVW